ncbi:MAG: glycosyltransferase family 2 protein, partial [Candidatus Saccharimonadales bacterium]
MESLINQAPLLSIVMPTHNRAQYAEHAISSILSNLRDTVELVVHDTSDDDVLASYAKGITDSRLIYRHIREPLSMTENYNRALQLARGEYVCVIGDDDGVSPEIEVATEWAKRNDIKILSPRVTANYVWPDFRSRFLGSAHAGRLYVKRRFSRIAQRKTGPALGRALSRAAMGTEGLPKVYHGIVRRAFLDKLASVSGSYFHGTSPDMSGAVGLA